MDHAYYTGFCIGRVQKLQHSQTRFLWEHTHNSHTYPPAQRKTHTKSICKFYFPVMAAVLLCFTFEYPSASPDHTMTPSFVLQQQRRGSTLSALSDLPNLSPKARWGTHTAEVTITGQCNILCQEAPVVPGNAHIFLRCLAVQSLKSDPFPLACDNLSHMCIKYWGNFDFTKHVYYSKNFLRGK